MKQVPVSAETPEAIGFSVATLWSDVQIRKWAALQHGTRHVSSLFGCLQAQMIGHGRARFDVPYVSRARVAKHAEVARSIGLKFFYLLNGLCRHLDLDEDCTRKRFFEELEWIAGEVRPDAVVIADLRVARAVRSLKCSKSLGIRVSTIAGVRTPHDIAPWLSIGIEGVVLHHDLSRDFDALDTWIEFIEHEHPEVETELLVNESCMAGCFARKAHYARLAESQINYQEGFQQNCNAPRFFRPRNILAAGWIRPEDVEWYRGCGVQRFKIAGREMTTTWLDRAVHAYLLGRHEGNLVELLTMTPPGLDVASSEIVTLDNSALSDFLGDVIRRGQVGWDVYRLWAIRLWQDKDLRILDPGSAYDIVDGDVQCTKHGRYLAQLLALRLHSDRVFDKCAIEEVDHYGVDQ